MTIVTIIDNSNKENPETCDIWDTDNHSDNWEPEIMTIFVIWQLIVTLDSIRYSCDVFFAKNEFWAHFAILGTTQNGCFSVPILRNGSVVSQGCFFGDPDHLTEFQNRQNFALRQISLRQKLKKEDYMFLSISVLGRYSPISKCQKLKKAYYNFSNFYLR